MSETIKWSQIEAECGGYRAGFVATFRKYENLPTDEKDGQGRTVKVTVATFARHVGIPDPTFRSWVKKQDRTRDDLAPGRRQGQMGRQIAKSPTVGVDDKVGMLQDLLSDKKVIRAWRENRAPATSESDAKAAVAAAKALTDGLSHGAAQLQVPMWVDQLKAIAKELSEYEFDEDEIRSLRRAETKLADELTVQEFRLGMVEADR